MKGEFLGKIFRVVREEFIVGLEIFLGWSYCSCE